jgi:Ser/Thr protein kinase RdoA (MazF antagonist)
VEPRELAAAIGVDLLGRLPHGEGSGAYAVQLADGTRAVLKLYTGDVLDLGTPGRIIDALRARGYPAPATLATGTVDTGRDETSGYEIIEFLPGAPIEVVPRSQLGRVAELIAMQRAVGLPGRAPWLEDVITSVLDGRDGYCEHTAMAGHSPGTRALLDRLMRIAERARGVDVARTDVVHYDFSPYNILVSDGTITGVVDWAGATSGDAAFDLVTLAFYTYDESVRDELLATAAAATDPRALALYAAHMVLRQVDWSLRHHDAGTVDRFIGIGIALLAAVGSG